MFYTFKVSFKNNEELFIKDINQFENKQIFEIRRIAVRWTRKHLQAQKNGIDIDSIEEKHFKEILRKKNDMVDNISSTELFDKKIIKVTAHSLDQALKRMDSNNRDTFINLIDRLKKTDKVKKTQWKGYDHLTYTLTKQGDVDNYQFAIAFRFYPPNNKLKIITVIKKKNEQTSSERMEQRISDDPRIAAALKLMEERFKKS